MKQIIWRKWLCLVLLCFSVLSHNERNFVFGEGEGYLVKTLAGNTAFAFDIGLMTNAKDMYLQDPCGICLGISDDMFVSDCGRHLILRIFPNESVVVVGGMGFSGWNNDGYIGRHTLFNTPSSLSVAPNGDVYVSDTNNDKIRIISSSTALVSSISHTFNRPLGVFVSSNNIVYIADTGNNLIKKYDINTGIVSVIGGGGYLDGSNDNVDAKLLLLNGPTSIFAVSNGKSDTIYFTDSERVKSIDSKGIYRIVDSTLSKFYGIQISNSNEIWTTSSTSHFVQKKIIGDSQATIIGGQDLPDYYGDGLVDEYSNVRFYEPTSLVVKNSNVYIADKSNNCIRKIDTINKIVTTVVGGIVNHPYGENIPPLENNPSSTFTYPFYYKNELFFFEDSIILRKVSNGLVKTVAGSFSELKTPNTPTRTKIFLSSFFNFGNGDVVFGGGLGIYAFNIDSLQLVQLSKLPIFHLTGYGNSVENGTLFIGDNRNVQNIHIFRNGTISKTITIAPYASSFTFSNINSTTLFLVGNYQLIKLDLDQPSNYELISTPALSPNYVTHDTSDTSKIYLSESSRIFEMRLNDSSFQLLVGLHPIITSTNQSVSFNGYNGENIPALKSVLQVPSMIVQNGIILASNINGFITLISNGNTRTLIGRTPSTVPKKIAGFDRDEDKKIVYLVDNRTLKKYNETSGETTPLFFSMTTTAIYSALIKNPLPYFWVFVARVPLLTFSKFDGMLYVLDACRIIQIDPMTLKFSKIAGRSCGAIDFGVTALESPLPLILGGIFNSNPNNGDLYFIVSGNIHRLEMSTGMIRPLLTLPYDGTSSPDGIVTNTTKIGTVTFFRVVNDDIYFCTGALIRVLEIQSDGGYYLRTLVGNGVEGYSGDNLPALESSLFFVNSFFVKQNGDIIIIDSSAYLIRKYVKKTGILKNLAGTPNQGSANYMGDLKGSDISFVTLGKSISVNEKTDELYITDSRWLRKLSISCEGMSTFNANNNTCSCLSGYYGDKCQPHSCNGTLASDSKTCSGNGKCTDFDVCACKDGYTGQYCQLSAMVITEAALIVAIVVPICGCLLLIVILSVLVIIVACCLVKKKRDNKQDDNIATIDSKNIELFDFPSNRSIVMSSSLGSSTGSEAEDAFSRYANIVKIGQGAFGSVFKVTDIKQGNKTKAVKVIQFQSFSDLTSVMKEASQLSNIRHPNVLKVNDYFVTNDHLLCIDMDYYENGDLTRFYKEDCPEGIVKLILRQMCDALNFVHSQLSIIHRDIKPSNIFIKSLSKDWKHIEIVLADFGLAKKHQEMKGQSYAGTPIYMSPEIALGSSYSFNTDLFSLGVSIYQIMTKDTTTSISGLLMGNQNAQSILTQQMKQANVEYSEELIQIVLQMLDKNQQTRPNASDILSIPYLNK